MKKLDLDINQIKEMLIDEMEQTDAFLKEVQGHYEKIKNSRSAGTLKFISDQTSNINTIRSGKVAIIKEIGRAHV